VLADQCVLTRGVDGAIVGDDVLEDGDSASKIHHPNVELDDADEVVEGFVFAAFFAFFFVAIDLFSLSIVHGFATVFCCN